MIHPTLQNFLAEHIRGLDFPVYDFDSATSTLVDAGRTVKPTGVLAVPEEIVFGSSTKVRGQIMTSQRWEVKVTFNETVYCHEVFTELAAEPPQVRAVVPSTGQRERPGHVFNWNFHLDRVLVDYIPSAGSQKGSSYTLVFDVTHA